MLSRDYFSAFNLSLSLFLSLSWDTIIIWYALIIFRSFTPIMELALFARMEHSSCFYLRDQFPSFHFPLDLTDWEEEKGKADGHYNGRLSLKAISINCSSKYRPTETVDPLGKVDVYWKLSYTARSHMFLCKSRRSYQWKC